ncbi:MAG TPA: hypothetical protein VFK42_16300 [Acidimicrobiales bacterium]|nr:hypothetical protein [Acidimicrobiales bacterium]
MPVENRLEMRRWDGSTAGRTEVWYDTFTDPASGAGFWLHHELVSPSDGRPAFVHGWAAAFPALGDAAPVWERFGPLPDDGAEPFFSCGDVVCEPGVRRGATSRLEWDLRYVDASPPLFTFPRWSWERDVLPGSQIVPSPSASFSGEMSIVGGRDWTLVDAPGAAARIYGHGNAQRWAWLHADLGGSDGDVLEIVAAVSRRRLLDRLPPLPMVQLRVGGRDVPSRPLASGVVALRAHVALPSWSVRGRLGGSPFRVDVTLPPERCVVIPYTDPDGAGATCTNSERADAVVTWGSRVWRLDATAHAEVGLRP